MTLLHLRRLALAVACLYSLAGHAEDSVDSRAERNFTPVPPSRTDKEGPVYIDADQMDGVSQKNIKARGSVHMRKQDLAVDADAVEYTDADTTAIATGNVTVDRAGDRATGPYLRLNVQTEEGYMETPEFYFAKKLDRRRAARGSAARLQFEGPNKERLFDTQYTTCSPGNDDWFLRTKELELDRVTQIGTASHATIIFKDVPILYLPFLDFPLNNKRKSGFLAPSFGSTGNNGLVVETPYYWNIAPNYDATITPRLLTKRGLQLNNEFRYLERNYLGQIDAEYLAGDRLTNSDRYFGRLQHRQTLLPDLKLALDLQKASDDNYFRDLSTRIASTSQTYLPRDALLSYSFGTYWAASAHYLQYQVLQDPLNPIGTPYTFGPQVQLDGNRANYYGFDLGLHTEWTNFVHPTLVNAERLIAYPTVSFPMTRSFGYVTPKIGYHSTHYEFGTNNTTDLPAINRNLPIASVDSGLFLDRSVNFGNTAYTQTLEPRVLYVKTPFRDQSQIPNFSTSELDFGFAQIFSDNLFIGGDRIADMNNITVGATSRLIDAESGIERIRTTLAQRFFFTPQRVTLSGSPQDDKRSDVLVGLSGQITDRWSLDSAIQYNGDLGRTERYLVAARYRPGPAQILNLGYRFTRDSLHQVDISTQWPLGANWQALARMNYSLQDRRLLEGLVGLEYTRDCWAVRMVAHRFPTAEQRYTNSFFIQLELTGLSALGINPLETLKQNIPGYVRTSEISR
jgi:LPS-assembly protein